MFHLIDCKHLIDQNVRHFFFSPNSVWYHTKCNQLKDLKDDTKGMKYFIVSFASYNIAFRRTDVSKDLNAFTELC